MPGINVILGDAYQEKILEQAIEDLQSDSVSTSQVLFRAPHIVIVFSGNVSYPILYYETAQYVLCFDGMIYNFSRDILNEKLITLCEYFILERDTDEKIADFVNETDGDFLCLVYLKQNSRLIVFNDRWGRLPAFHYSDDNLFVLSREIKFILHFIPSLILDRMSIVQFLMFEYQLGDRTFFHSVHRFLPSNKGIVSFDNTEPVNKISKNITQSFSISFDVTDPEVSRDDCLKKIVSLFLESTENRASTCSKSGFKLISDVSGGYDTRANIAALERLGIDAEYYTHNLVTGNESRVAKELIAKYHKQLKAINVSHKLTLDELSDIVYVSDCQVNGWTAGTAWKDSYKKRNLFHKEERIANFMGFGGSVTRHPLLPVFGYPTLSSMVMGGVLPGSLDDNIACDLVNVPLMDFRYNLIDYFTSYPEKTLEGCLKRLYFEYSNHLVSAGEDRTRRLFWTVQSFWSNFLYMYETHNFPLSYPDFLFLLIFSER